MKTQKELTQLLSQKVEEINLSQQVELAALTPEQSKTFIASINKIVGELSNIDFEVNKASGKDLTEFESAMKLLDAAIKKIRSIK
jgi:hypothetical protein